MSAHEAAARAKGWFPAQEVSYFKNADAGQVVRYLVGGETYDPETDSLMSSPMRHADDWQDACRTDGLVVGPNQQPKVTA